jgi:sugar/nucleoside kinase (ribokinase family)
MCRHTQFPTVRLQVLEQGGHSILLFSNKEEASELCGEGRFGDARSAAAQLGGLCSLSVVTDGANGSQVSCMGEIIAVPPPDAPNGVVDTCGAGDAYAAGFCYALMMGHDCSVAGKFGGSVAGRVIGRHGAQLLEHEAEGLVKLLPAACTFARP